MIMASCSPIGANTCLSSAPKSLHNESWPQVVYLTYSKGNGSHILYSYTRLSLYHDISCDITPHHILVCLSYQMFMSDTQLIVLIHQHSFPPKTRESSKTVRASRPVTSPRDDSEARGDQSCRKEQRSVTWIYMHTVLVHGFYVDLLYQMGWWWLSVHKCLSRHCENPALFPLLSVHGGIHCLLLR